MLSQLEQKIRDKAWFDFRTAQVNWLYAHKEIIGHDIIAKVIEISTRDRRLRLEIENQAVITFLKDFDDLKERVDQLEYLKEG